MYFGIYFFRLLTAKNITHQLLYRYYREIEKCQRSALKKILEKDESTAKRIILCVSKVIKVSILVYDVYYICYLLYDYIYYNSEASW